MVNQLLFTAWVADLKVKLCRLVSEFGRVFNGRKLSVNESKVVVMRCLYCVTVALVDWSGSLVECT